MLDDAIARNAVSPGGDPAHRMNGTIAEVGDRDLLAMPHRSGVRL